MKLSSVSQLLEVCARAAPPVYANATD